VIATKVGDIPEIVRHRENGLLIEPGNTQALASAILEFISDPELAAHCAANGLRYATENFSFDKMMEAKLGADLKITKRAMERRAPASPASQELRPPSDEIS
jgi:glycosyltransferase involved in cell wall biosynthesis